MGLVTVELSLPHRLREALVAADYTHDAVVDLIGTTAHAALGRNETVPAARRTTGGSPLDTLVRLFLLQRPVGRGAADAALPGLVDQLAADGFLAVSVDEVVARLDVRPYAEDGRDLWVVSDLTPGMDGAPQRVTSDYVLGISGASTSLAQLTLRRPAARALDLGTGCGVQALHLAGHTDRVVATDVNPRALRIAAFNAALNDVEDRVEVRDGSLFDPVADEDFDLIATNPPFVISPGTDELLVYRDSGLPRDSVVERIVREIPARLAPDGWGQVLANWIIARDQSWDERLASWLSPDCDALVVQREVLDPPAYVELWLRDAGLTEDYTRRYDTWLSWFDQQGIEAVGFGWVNLHRTEAAGGARHTLLEWPYDVEQPIAPAIQAWGGAAVAERALDDEALLATHLSLRGDVRQETHGRAGEVDPETIVLRQQRGFRRARTADTVVAGFAGAADGDLAAGDLLDALATLLQREPGEVRTSYLPVLRELVAEGFLELSGPEASTPA